MERHEQPESFRANSITWSITSTSKVPLLFTRFSPRSWIAVARTGLSDPSTRLRMPGRNPRFLQYPCGSGPAPSSEPSARRSSPPGTQPALDHPCHHQIVGRQFSLLAMHLQLETIFQQRLEHRTQIIILRGAGSQCLNIVIIPEVFLGGRRDKLVLSVREMVRPRDNVPRAALCIVILSPERCGMKSASGSSTVIALTDATSNDRRSGAG